MYVGRSNLYRKDPINGTYSKSIGFGLFTSEDIVVGERIVSFNGETITREEYHLRTAAGRGGYITYLSEEAYLDCYNTRHANECLASLANCALHCYDSKHNRFAINNAEYRSILRRINEMYVHFQKLYVHFHLSETVSDKTKKIGPYSLTRVKITPKVLIISYLFANYYDQIIMC